MLRAAVKLASKASSSSRLGGSSLSWSRNYAAKEIRFGSEGRASMLKGVESLADAVRVTMGPKINYRNYTVIVGLNQSDMEDDQSLKGDKLILRGLKFHGFHGVKPEERTLGQKFVIDVDAWLDLRAAGISDNLSDTVSYTDIYRIVKEVVEGEPQNLLESVVHKIAHNTFTKFSQISVVRVKVGKPHVAVHGQLDYLGVEILRTRKIDAQS